MTFEFFSEQQPTQSRKNGRLNVYLDETIKQIDNEEEQSTQYGYTVLRLPVTTPPKQVVAAVRYHYEVAGINVGGLQIATDDRSKTLIAGKWNRAMLAKQEGDTAWTCRFKAPTGWTVLDADQMITIGLAVEDHVQRCFDREGELAEAIESGEGYDLRAGWPG